MVMTDKELDAWGSGLITGAIVAVAFHIVVFQLCKWIF